MKILITGASGFIGTNFIEYLLKNKIYDFLNLDKNPPLKSSHIKYWHKCNILNKENLKIEFDDFKPNYVLHLAARTDCDGSTLSDYIDNTIGTENVISAIKSCDSVKRAIFTSTQYVFRPGDKHPANDQDFNPHTEYGQSKVLNELAVRNADLECIWTIIRPTNIWGPWHLRYRDQFLKVLYTGKYFHPKSDNVIKSYGYVGNVVDQIFKIFQADGEIVNRQVFYVGDRPLKLLDWVNAFSNEIKGKNVRVLPNFFVKVIALIGDLLSFSGIKFPITSSRYNSMVTNYITSVEKTINTFGNSKYTLTEGVTKTLNWLMAEESGADYCRSKNEL